MFRKKVWAGIETIFVFLLVSIVATILSLNVDISFASTDVNEKYFKRSIAKRSVPENSY